MGGITVSSIDITTMALTRGIMQMMLGGLLLYLGSRHGSARDARWWALGFFFNGISLIVFPFQLPPEWQSPRIVVNHLSLGISSLFFLIGFWKFTGRRSSPWLLALVMAFPLVSVLFWELLWSNARYRVLCTAVGQVLYFILLQQALSRPPREEVARTFRRLRVIVLIYLVVHVWSYASVAELLPLSARPPLDYHRSIFSVASLLFMLTLAVGCLALQFSMLAARNADLARRDWLTGLLNRRGFFGAIRGGEQPRRVGKAVTSLLAIDIDHFKKINDSRGHAVGDLVLQQFGKELKALENESRLIARMGGEEFLVALLDAPLDEAFGLAEAIRQKVELGALVTATGEPLQFTISVGVYALAPGEDLDAALAHADTALYAAKQQGRNQVALLPAMETQPGKRHFRSATRSVETPQL